jgi:hypothetical protein
MANGEAVCWCTALPAALPVPTCGDEARCYCSDCLQRSIAKLAQEKARKKDADDRH